MADQAKSPPIVATHVAGARFVAQARSHRIVLDQPVSGGGEDAGPTPLELLGAALAGCVALYVQRFLAARDLPFTGLRVEVEPRRAEHPYRIGEFAVRVLLAEPIPAHFVPLLERVARSCPAHNTLAAGAEVQVSVEAAEMIVAGD